MYMWTNSQSQVHKYLDNDKLLVALVVWGENGVEITELFTCGPKITGQKVT